MNVIQIPVSMMLPVWMVLMDTPATVMMDLQAPIVR